MTAPDQVTPEDDPLIFVDGGSPVPQSKLREWMVEAERLRLWGWSEIAYLQQRADSWRAKQEASA